MVSQDFTVDPLADFVFCGEKLLTLCACGYRMPARFQRWPLHPCSRRHAPSRMLRRPHSTVATCLTMPSHFLSCTTSCTRHSATSALRSLRAGVLLNRKPWSRHCRARRGFGGHIRGGRSCTPWSSMLLPFYLSPFSWESSIRDRR